VAFLSSVTGRATAAVGAAFTGVGCAFLSCGVADSGVSSRMVFAAAALSVAAGAAIAGCGTVTLPAAAAAAASAEERAAGVKCAGGISVVPFGASAGSNGSATAAVRASRHPSCSAGFQA
jgi:hypothetical protein